MVKVTNTSEVRQAVHTTAGVLFIAPGASRDVELSGPGAKFVERSDVLDTPAKRGRKSTKKAVEAFETVEATDPPEDE